MPDRLRELIDLVIASLDEPVSDGRALATRAHFSRDHFDRLLAAATGESPVGLRRRLLLERAAWQLRAAGATPSDVAPAAGYASLAAFSRAFSRAYGIAPSAFAAEAGAGIELEAPNGIHFHPPAGLLIPGGRGGGPVAAADRSQPGAPAAGRVRDVTDRLLAHHLDRTRELLLAARPLPAEALARPLRPGFVAVWFEGEEPSAALMAQRLVATVEIWVAAIAGQPNPLPAAADADADDATPDALLRRLYRAGPALVRLARAIDRSGAWDDAFVDALCEPPQSFTYGGVLAHVLTYGAIRREMLAAVLAELGAAPLASGDPIEWEAGR